MNRALLILSALVGVSAPLTVAFGAMGADIGWVSFETGFWLLTLTIGWWLAVAGVGLGLVAAILNLRGLGRAWPWLIAGLVVPAAALGGLWTLQSRLDALPPLVETSTDWTDPPAYSDAILSRRGRVAAPVLPNPVIAEEAAARRSAWAVWSGLSVAGANARACPSARTIARLADSEAVVAALEAEGVRVIGQSLWRVEGFQESAFYGRVRDVVVRMEPGATDIRVTERVGDVDLGDTCDLAASLVERLSP